MAGKQRRKSKQEREREKADLALWERSRQFVVETAKRAIKQRSKEREFHGLEREFFYHQAELAAAYDRSRDIKHPRDVGNAREQILREFLTNSGFVPRRYGVSDRSARVASPSGHLSKEIDILFYDALDGVTLMERENVYQVFPIESVYGVIQVKSRLNKEEIADGLANIASFKRLDRGTRGGPVVRSGKAQQGFGVLFAYSSDLPWMEIVNELEGFAKANPPQLWTNLIVILNQGMFLHGEESGVFSNTDLELISGSRMFGSTNTDLEAISRLRIFGFAEQGQTLFSFYRILLSLLRGTEISPAEPDAYFRLPLVAQNHSYQFAFGPFAEIGHCEKHGDYQRKISPKNLDRVVSWCAAATPINWILAHDLAYGSTGTNVDAYERQPGDVHIYNPDNLPLSDISTHETLLSGRAVRALAYDAIQTAGMLLWIPNYYSAKEGIIDECPACARARSKARPARKGRKTPPKG